MGVMKIVGLTVQWGKTALLQIWVVRWLVRFVNVLFVGWVSFFLFPFERGEEKNIINSRQICTELPTMNPLLHLHTTVSGMKRRAFRSYLLVHRDKVHLETETCGNHSPPYVLYPLLCFRYCILCSITCCSSLASC